MPKIKSGQEKKLDYVLWGITASIIAIIIMEIMNLTGNTVNRYFYISAVSLMSFLFLLFGVIKLTNTSPSKSEEEKAVTQKAALVLAGVLLLSLLIARFLLSMS